MNRMNAAKGYWDAMFACNSTVGRKKPLTLLWHQEEKWSTEASPHPKDIAKKSCINSEGCYMPAPRSWMLWGPRPQKGLRYVLHVT